MGLLALTKKLLELISANSELGIKLNNNKRLEKAIKKTIAEIINALAEK